MAAAARVMILRIVCLPNMCSMSVANTCSVVEIPAPGLDSAGMRLLLAHRTVDLDGPPLAMAIVNVTPDSFYDGGRQRDPEQAVARALEMLAAGAAIVDVGGMTAQPGAVLGEDEEAARVVPTVSGIRAAAPERRDLGGHLPRRGRWRPRPGRRRRPGQRPHRRCRPASGRGRRRARRRPGRHAPRAAAQAGAGRPLRDRPSTRSPSHCSSAPPPPRRPASGATRSCSTPASASASRPPPTWPACAPSTG